MDITWGVQLSHELAWGWLIALYLFLAGVSGGSFLTAALTDLFGKQRPEKVIRSGAYIAPISIVIGLALLVFDLGKPLSFWKLLIYVNFGSVMSLGVFIVSGFSALSVAYAGLVWLDAQASKRISINSAGKEFMPSAKADREIAAAAISGKSTSGQGLQAFRKPVAVIGALFALGTATYTGFLLSDVATNHLWHTPLFGMTSIPFLPILFLVSALSAGLAATLIGAVDCSDLTAYKKVDITLIALEILLLAILYVSIKPIFFTGSMAMIFWLGVVVVGLLIPLVLSIYGVAKHKNLVLPVCSMVVIGGFCLRYFVVYSGQLFK